MSACTEKYTHRFSPEKEEEKEHNSYWWQECLPIVDGKVQWGWHQPDRDYGERDIESWDWPRDGYLIRDVGQHQLGCGWPPRRPDGTILKGPWQDVERVKDRTDSFCDLVRLWEEECSEAGCY